MGIFGVGELVLGCFFDLGLRLAAGCDLKRRKKTRKQRSVLDVAK
jgi:hypothetical protein